MLGEWRSGAALDELNELGSQALNRTFLGHFGKKHHVARLGQRKTKARYKRRQPVFHQRFVQPTGGCITERRQQHIECREIRVARRRPVIRQRNIGCFADTTHSHFALAVLGWLAGVGELNRLAWLGDLAKGSDDFAQSKRRFDAAGNQKGGVVRPVVLSIKGLQALDRQILDVGARTNRRIAVVVPQVRGGGNAINQHARGIVLARFHLVAHDGHL